MYRQFTVQSGNPDGNLVLADFLARQGRLEDALAVCKEAAQKCDPDKVAIAGRSVLFRTAPTEPVLEHLETWLSGVLEKKPDTPAFLILLGNLRERQGRDADAEASYRKVIERDPHQVDALNSLAYLLALKHVKASEGLELIQDAIDRGGANAMFLDTRAVAYLALGQTDLAIKDLREAIADTPSAIRYLHLTQAYLTAQNRSAAAETFRKARSFPLTLDQVHPVDRTTYYNALRDLGQ
jgi:tetratricopeptide (TPR) repeat protein